LTVGYVLQAGAAEDLRSVIRYTRETWGAVQARAYADKLQKGLERLVQGQGAYKILVGVHPALRVSRCEHHYIFCLMRENAPALVIAILHEKMDLIARITDRLS
jgi:toxin ParE1/3/4